VVTALLALLPLFALAKNYQPNDRSTNALPTATAKNLLNSCQENGILFTTGDNETFTLWAMQEVYGYRTDVKVVNTSLLQGDWYVEQMKNINGVPMSLTDEQILAYPVEVRPGVVRYRPLEEFTDRPRGVKTYLYPYQLENRIVNIPEMVIDDIILENACTK